MCWKAEQASSMYICARLKCEGDERNMWKDMTLLAIINEKSTKKNVMEFSTVLHVKIPSVQLVDSFLMNFAVLHEW